MKNIYSKSRKFFVKELTQTSDSSKKVGCFDRISETGTFEGWAVDKENPDDFVTVYVFIDGVLTTSAVAELYRGDLINAKVKENGKAAFSVALEVNKENQAMLKPNAKVDIAFDKENKQQLKGSGKPLGDLFTNKVIGNFDRVSEQGTIEGWAVDKDNLAEFVKVYVFIDNVLVSSGIADAFRADLAGAKIKEDGRAGFSIVLKLNKNNQTLLKPGAKIDVAFDELNQKPLKESGKKLSKDNVNALLSACLTHSIPVMSQVASVIALVRSCNEADQLLDDAKATSATELLQQSEEDELAEEDGSDNLPEKTEQEKADEFLALCKHAGFAVVRTAYQLYQLECYEQLLHFLAQVTNPEVLPFCQLECTLFRVIVLTESDLLSEQAITLLDTAFYERANDSAAKQQSVYFSSYVDAATLGFYTLLQTKIAQLAAKSDQNNHLLGKVALVMSFWQHKLHSNPHLALNFLTLLQSSAPELLITIESQQLLAHLRRELGDSLTALTHCLNAIKQNTDYWWAYHEAAVILGVLSNNHRLLFKDNLSTIEDYFYRAFLLNPYQSKSLREFEQALSKYFFNSHDLSWQLAEADFVTEALNERDTDLQILIRIISRIYAGKFHSLTYSENNPVTRQNSLANKVVFVGSRGLFQCYYYRVQQKLEQAEQLNLSIDYLDLTELNQRNWQRMLMNVAVLYVCRIPATINEIKLMCYAKGLGITIVYDIDDLIFDASAFPAELETYAGTIDERTHLHLTMDNPFFLSALKLADVCVASTQSLAMEIRKQIKESVPIKIHPNVLSYELYAAAQIYKPAALKTPQVPVTVIYGSATKAHKQSFYDVFFPAMLEVMAQNSKVQLVLIGYFDNLFDGVAKKISQRISVLAPTSDFMGYINLVKTADINIAILEQSRLTDTKSEIKWLEAAAFGIPSVVTPTQAYRDVLTDGENVLFASTQEDWEKQLLSLLQDADLRKSMGLAAKKLAFEKFSPQVGESVLKETVSPFLSPLSLKKTKKRVLLVNVFFYPQSVGGATRVFENQVRGLIERYPDEYEVFVLTSEADPDTGRPYYMEQYWFDNVLVTRLNIPPRNWVDHDDVHVYDFCVQFFKEYRFDIVHIHSIQVLTASLVDAAITSKIPYIITLHDAWWLSIYQFLVNPEGQLVDHTEPLSGISENETGVDWIVKRHRRLQRVLSKANAVVAVSKKFAQLYQEAGVSNVQVHENYVEPFTNLEPRHQQTDKIVLGFIGGMSTHKGYDLLKKALQEGHFPNLLLIVINHSLHSGEVHYSKWGDTDVEFRAKEKQSEVAKLYAQFDVLLAPSIWPESYGLVTREALQANLWVIASDRGAIGDCIIEGVNGNIVNVEDHLGLLTALQNLPAQLEQRNNNENLSADSNTFTGETMDSHLQQLVTMYQSVLENNN